MMTLQQACGWIGGAQLVGNGQTRISRVHTDTRSLEAGDLFVALKGERFDAHSFLPQAKAQGAVAAIAQHGVHEAGLPGLQVSDPKAALGQLAAGWRSQFALPLVAVTGSNGKTTVTQMVACILRAFRPSEAFATEGNLNNDIGVPLTLLRLGKKHRIGVVELGMNHPGEIAYLAKLAQPTVALVNNAQREHLEFMGTVEAVAFENGAVIDALGPDGVAVFPADDDYTSVWKTKAGKRQVLTFALAGKADVTATASWTDLGWHVKAATPLGAVTFALNIAGEHNVKNALAAVACCIAAGVPLPAIAAGLTAFEPVKGRSRAIQIQLQGRSVTVIDDTYNANPDSMRAAIDVLATLPGPRLLVMGDMGEVGDRGPQFNTEAGQCARAQGIDSLFTLGDQAGLASRAFMAHNAVSGGTLHSRHFDGVDDLNAAVKALLPSLGSVLVKGSRFMKMERVVQAITAEPKTKEVQHAD